MEIVLYDNTKVLYIKVTYKVLCIEATTCLVRYSVQPLTLLKSVNHFLCKSEAAFYNRVSLKQETIYRMLFGFCVDVISHD